MSATASNAISPVSAQAALYKDGKKVADFVKVQGEVAFDLPGAFLLKTEKSVADFDDGEYVLKVEATSANGNIACEKKVTFAGKAVAKLSAESKALARKLEEKDKSISTDKRFALLVKLGELKSAISSNKLADAERLVEELKSELK